MNDIKKTVAQKLIMLRQQNKMTQLELAERLNYSDKAVSKWERGESLPDLSVLVQLADMFGVSLDYLVKENADAPLPQDSKQAPRYSRSIITLVSLFGVLFAAMLGFVLSILISPETISFSWLFFIYAVPVGSIVWLILNSIWFNQKINYLIISVLMWSAILSVHLTLHVLGIETWPIYLLGIPAQIIILLSSFIKKRNR